MPPRRKTLTEQDRADWAVVAREVHRLDGVAPEPPPSAPAAPVPPLRPAAPPMARPVPPSPLGVGDHPPGLDRASWNRFRSGRLPAMRTLDLHGRTTQLAFHALHAFLQAAQADRVRCVEVITGRGAGEGGGVIRREFPLWLNLPALRPLVLAASHPHAANPGAVRLLLRRPR